MTSHTASHAAGNPACAAWRQRALGSGQGHLVFGGVKGWGGLIQSLMRLESNNDGPADETRTEKRAEGREVSDGQRRSVHRVHADDAP